MTVRRLWAPGPADFIRRERRLTTILGHQGARREPGFESPLASCEVPQPRRLPPDGVCGVGRAGQPARARVRARADPRGPRLRPARARARVALPRGVPGRGRSRAQRLAARPQLLRGAAVRVRHGGADRAARRRGGRLGRHVDGRADRHRGGRPGGHADPPARDQRRRSAPRCRGDRAHRHLPRRAGVVRHGRRGDRLRVGRRRAVRREAARGLARAGRAGAAARRRALAAALRSGASRCRSSP